MTETANYKFQKPGLDGAANIEVLDSNWDKADAAINAKADKLKSASVTIPVSGWKSDSASGYPYYYDISALGVTASDCVSVVIAPSSQQAAAKCGLCPTNETLAGIIRVRSSSIPPSAISAQYWVEQGKEN